jgi:hypothetical protein
MWEE